jgi:hypothetical protein
LSHRKQRPKGISKSNRFVRLQATGIPASRSQPVAGSCRRSSGNRTAKFRTTLPAYCQVAPIEPSSPLNFQNTSDANFTDPTFYVQYIKRHFLCEYKRNIQDLDPRTRYIKKRCPTSKLTSKIKKGAGSHSVSTRYNWCSRQCLPTPTTISIYRLLEILSKNIHFNPMQKHKHAVSSAL